MMQQIIIKKIPGEIPGPTPKEKQGYIEDLTKKTKSELLELIERQDKLLGNKTFAIRLPDKGAKITQLRSRLAEELAQRDEVEKACGLLSGLNLGKPSVTDEIEWTGSYSPHNKCNKLDSDDESDDERNPFKILASQAGVGTYRKKLRVENGEPSLIKPEDLEEIHSHKIVGKDDVYVKRLCDKLQKPTETKKEKYLPHRTTKSGQLDGYKKPLGPHWEVTAATPPPPVHGDTKLISLHESLDLQKEQATKLQELQAKQAAEKLAAQLGLKMGDTLPDPTLRSAYRDEQYHSDSSSDSEDEMANIDGEFEEEEPEKDGAVIYNIVD
ncbi:hypothetical protein L9F63_001363 [Diploptera punctata]|uniref:Uncharacterized protein n=1 Tax=Diploptera punctata TaxID=6984 RepID=A0AAD8EIS4_DIPPU|nr:hypothetical protein L9F63_001363 [Diploptera punctata]